MISASPTSRLMSPLALITTPDTSHAAEQTIKGSNSDRQLQWNARVASAPSPIWFTYIQSPGRLTPRLGGGVGALPVSGGLLEPGRITTTLDLEGQLLSIERTPTSADLARPATGEPDWTSLFTAAGLDIIRFSPSSTEPRLELPTVESPGPDRTSTRIRRRSGSKRPAFAAS